ncbi:MAG: histidinol dehydrogenase [Firmicutes bacterium]|nr:histidinol dehydrogenase [Bacillota bacterium]
MIQTITPADERFATLLRGRAFDLEKVTATVTEIVNAVKKGGDQDLCAITARLDGVALEPANLPVSAEEIKQAYGLVSEEFLTALRRAAENILRYHRRQLKNSWLDPQPNGAVLGQLITPLRRVGIYVPGGKASYPSSVLMNAIPAAVAGVPEIVMVTPPARNGAVNPHTLVAAAEAGVTEIYRIGGAQAVAALAYGTATIPKVDKITGPGNIYVTAAKRMVYGAVDIDMLAGPSEVLIVADDTARADFVAADMLAQAEHDEMASAILVTPAPSLAEAVGKELAVQLEQLERRSVAAASLAGKSFIVLTASLEEAFTVANRFAPEHLELMVAEPYRWLGRVTAAGAVFLGHYSPEAVGDYIAGPNHILPTGGTARFFSPLNVDVFTKKTSLIDYSRQALREEGEQAMTIAATEGLGAHLASIKIRLAGEEED